MPDIALLLEELLALRTSGWLMPAGLAITGVLLFGIVLILKQLASQDFRRLQLRTLEKASAERRRAGEARAVPPAELAAPAAAQASDPLPRVMRPVAAAQPPRPAAPRQVGQPLRPVAATAAAPRPSRTLPEGVDPAAALRRFAASETGLPALAAAHAALARRTSARAAGAPDDLKRIRGVGTLIERKLNDLGVDSYRQIAAWNADEVARITSALGGSGRIERESWIEQARILAAGGATDFSRRIDAGTRFMPERRRPSN